MNSPKPRPYGFPPHARVRSGADYVRVFAQGRRTAEPLLALHWDKRDTPARLGLAVSRKVDSRAIVRNRIKRVLRDEFRRLRPLLPPGDYVVVARPSRPPAASAQLRDAFRRALRRSGALPPPAADGTMPPTLNTPSLHSIQSGPVSG
ncbi:ribonuclease P protein component [Pseudoxanthomonas kalamensis DSM 18571]|uniref:ribonuclease P protein component n=1 Tax=Pseudoxanthomonas kalamensis TaxID=289483 RepID=UPI001391C001|nr:ribonuclease P protein component [Pseudoxanthomonas kalamensis]KAF1712332.1 ribonuclease P protein component [Pseudoxanthomonas kalamensis DSM 18571]